MADSDTSAEGFASAPATELHTSELPADAAMADLTSPPPISEVVEETLDAVDRELATLEAALQGELEPVAPHPRDAASLQELFRDETVADHQEPEEGSDVFGDSGDLAAAERELEAIASSMTVDGGMKETALQEATLPPATDVHGEENPASPTADLRSPPQTAAVLAEKTPEVESTETFVVEMSDIVADPSATESVEPISDAAPVKVSKSRKLVTVATLPLRAALCVLVVLDWPFSRLSPRLKKLLGYAGIATSVVAAATWAAAAHLKH